MSNYYNDGRGRIAQPRRNNNARGRSSGANNRGSGRGNKKKGRNLLPLLLLVLLVVIGVVAGVQYFTSQQEEEQLRLQAEAQEQQDQENMVLSQDTIYDGVSINGIALGGMTKEQAVSAVEAGLGMEQHTLTLSYEDKTYPVQLLTGSDLASVVEQAYQVGRSGTREENLATIESLASTPVDFTVEAGYSLPDMTEILASCSTDINSDPVNATVTGFDVDSTSFTFSEGQAGRTVDEAATLAAAQAAVDAENLDATVEIVVTEVAPDMDAATLKSKFKRLATFTTTTTSNSNRNTNIRLCSAAINGAVVQPGEEFSINTLTGERTAAKGYKDAAVIKNGVYIDEPGGGVCQVSSTLFNAVVRAGLEITERHNHTIASSYVPLGEDATIDYPGKDFKFRNNSEGPVAVVMSFDESNKKLTASVYGIPILEDGVTLDLESEVTATLEMPEPTYQEDPNLLYGEQLTVEEGREGSRVTTYLVTLKDGKEIDRKVQHTSTYPAKAPVVAINSNALPNTAPNIPEEGGSTQDGGDSGFLPEESADGSQSGFEIPEE
ncbi:MAG: VanW family protein [Candidatus Spyradocola sp.]|jgi:vancomycin resistance protein YoaR